MFQKKCIVKEVMQKILMVFSVQKKLASSQLKL